MNKTYFSNTDLFNKLPPPYYLNRQNHVGTQPISSIEGLQEMLDACTGIYASLAYVNQQDQNYYIAAKGYADSKDTALLNYLYPIDTSLFLYFSQFVKSSSLGYGLFWNNGLIDVSVLADVTKAYVDASLAQFIPSVSIGSTFKWENGLLDVSAIGDVTRAYVDGSLAKYVLSASTGIGLYWNNGLLDVSIVSGDVTKAYVDGSLAQFVKYDQTTPQTIINGIPFLDQSFSSFTDPRHIINKEYVDTALTAINANVYLLDTSSGVADYKNTSRTNPSLPETSISVSGISNGQVLGSWINFNTAASFPRLIPGIYQFHIHAEKTFGTKTLRLYWEFYERKIDNSEILIGISEISEEISAKGGVETHLVLSSEYEFSASTSRLVGKIVASVSGTGTNPTCYLYYLGTTSSHWSLPSNEDVLREIFTTYDYVDGSLAVLNASVNTAFLTNASLGNFQIRLAYLDACLGSTSILTRALNSSINAYATNASVNTAFLTNASLGNFQIRFAYIDACLGSTSILARAVNSSINAYATNASVNTAFLTNASLGNFQIRFTYIDACLGSTSILTRALNSSINLYSTNASIATASFTTNSSVANAFAQFVRSASIATSLGLKWNSGHIDVSITSNLKFTNGALDTSLGAVASSFATLTDGSIKNPSTNDTLKWDASWGKWMNKPDLWNVSTNQTTVYLQDPSDNLELSYIEMTENGGALLLVDMPCSSTTSGSEQSYAMKIDGSNALRIYGSGAGTVLSSTAVVMDANYFSIGDPATNGSWRFMIDTSGNLSVEKRIGGSWVVKGNFI